MPTPLLAFHSDAKIKRKYLGRVRAHRKADDIAAGHYWENRGGRMTGCAVGCTLHSSEHAAYETELGIPTVLARLEDRLFEGLWKHDKEAARMWPERFLSAAKPGADLSMIWPKFAHWLLVDPEAGVIRFAKKEKSIAAIKAVGALFVRWIGGDKPKADEWKNAADAAYCAYYADDADAAAAAAYAAYAAADAAAADAAYYYADAAAARGKHYSTMAEKLIELIKAA